MGEMLAQALSGIAKGASIFSQSAYLNERQGRQTKLDELRLANQQRTQQRQTLNDQIKLLDTINNRADRLVNLSFKGNKNLNPETVLEARNRLRKAIGAEFGVDVNALEDNLRSITPNVFRAGSTNESSDSTGGLGTPSAPSGPAQPLDELLSGGSAQAPSPPVSLPTPIPEDVASAAANIQPILPGQEGRPGDPGELLSSIFFQGGGDVPASILKGLGGGGKGGGKGGGGVSRDRGIPTAIAGGGKYPTTKTGFIPIIDPQTGKARFLEADQSLLNTIPLQSKLGAEQLSAINPQDQALRTVMENIIQVLGGPNNSNTNEGTPGIINSEQSRQNLEKLLVERRQFQTLNDLLSAGEAQGLLKQVGASQRTPAVVPQQVQQAADPISAQVKAPIKTLTPEERRRLLQQAKQ